MRYWTFDVCALIGDYESNKRRLVSIQEALKVARGFRENPVGTTSKGDWEQYIKVVELREAEYQMYVDMVILGLNDLPEVERLVLKFWLMDGYDDAAIIAHCGIKNHEELKKIKKIAVTKFSNIVMPE